MAADTAGGTAQAVYTALKETEQRATDVLPLWKLPALNVFSARQRKAAAAVALIRDTTERLIAQCREMVDDEEQACACRSLLVREDMRVRVWVG